MGEDQKLDFLDNGRRKREDRRKQRVEIPKNDRRQTQRDRRISFNRRRSLRIHKKITCRFQILKKDVNSEWDVLFLKNISLDGVLFQFYRKLEIGTLIDFIISFPDFPEQPVPFRASVISARRRGRLRRMKLWLVLPKSKSRL